MKISILGAGVMGSAVAKRLLDRKQDVMVYNRSLDKARPLLSIGCSITDDSIKAIKKSDCVLTFLTNAKAVNDVIFREKDILREKTIIQMGTIGPEESVLLMKKVSNCHGVYFECPVLGSRKEAGEGSLILMVGSSEELFLEWKDFFSLIGQEPKYIGEVGKAAALKLALNQLIASYAASFSLSLGIIEKNNVDVGVFSEILKQSSLYTGMFDKKIPNWIGHDYAKTNFSLKNLLKDVGLIIDEAKRQELSCDSLIGVRSIIDKALQQGLGDLDYSSLFEAVVNNKKEIK